MGEALFIAEETKRADVLGEALSTIKVFARLSARFGRGVVGLGWESNMFPNSCCMQKVALRCAEHCRMPDKVSAQTQFLVCVTPETPALL